MLRKLTGHLLLTLLITSISFAQSTAESVSEDNTKNSTEIDEFGILGECELGARLDNLFLKLQENPAATGYVIIYQGKNVLPANYGARLAERIKYRIRNQILFRNQDPSRFVFISGGFREELATELWLVPSGADEPTPTETVEAPVMPTDKTFLYDKNYVMGGDEFYDFTNEFILPSVKARLEEEARLAEEQMEAERADSEETTFEEPEIVEQSSENKIEAVEETSEIEEPTPEEIEEAKFYWANERFGEEIKKLKDARGVIIFYADDAYYDIGKLQSLVEDGGRKIAAANKISGDKIRVVYGGYRNMIETEFWIVPKKGQNPAATPENRLVEEAEIEAAEN